MYDERNTNKELVTFIAFHISKLTKSEKNCHAGPQLIISIYGLDLFGHDVIRGYGVCHLPLETGFHEKRYFSI